MGSVTWGSDGAVVKKLAFSADRSIELVYIFHNYKTAALEYQSVAI